jgi:phage-related protein
MGAVGPGVREIRIHTALEHRVLYVAKFLEAVYVLHAFQKRSRKTAKRDVDLAGQRYQELIRQRRLGGRNGG